MSCVPVSSNAVRYVISSATGMTVRDQYEKEREPGGGSLVKQWAVQPQVCEGVQRKKFTRT